MNTILAIALISMFILAPLLMVFAISRDSVTGKVITITLTTVVHVTFWVVFRESLESYETVFTFAGLYEIIALAGVYYIVYDALP